MADIFEVRGYPRPKRGTLLPIVLDGDRATFAYDGLDGARRTTTVVATDARLDPIDRRRRLAGRVGRRDVADGARGGRPRDDRLAGHGQPG